MVVPDRQELTEAPPRRWKGGGEVNIGALVIAAELEVLIDVVENLMG